MEPEQRLDPAVSDSGDTGPSQVRARPCAMAGNNTLISTPQEVTTEWIVEWAIARQRVYMARPMGMPGLPMMAPRGGRDSTLALGGGGGGMNMGFDAHPDAHAVRRAVDSLGNVAVAVRQYAMMGQRPDWTPYPQIRTKRGDTVIDSRSRRPSYCMFIYVGDLPEHVTLRRQRYAAWAQAIADVRRLLVAAGLQRHALLPDLPPLSPWEN